MSGRVLEIGKVTSAAVQNRPHFDACVHQSCTFGRNTRDIPRDIHCQLHQDLPIFTISPPHGTEWPRAHPGGALQQCDHRRAGTSQSRIK